MKYKSVSKRVKSLIDSYGNKLRYSDHTIQKAYKLARSKEFYLLFQGKTPRTVAIVSLYLSGLSNCEYRSRFALTKVCKLYELTIHSTIRKLMEKKKDVLKDMPIIQQIIKEKGKLWEIHAPDESVEALAAMNYMAKILVNLGLHKIDEEYIKNFEQLSSLVNELFFD